MIEEEKKVTPYQILKFIFIIIGGVALGLFVVNQALQYYYKIEFLKTPCDLCLELNPRLENCFKNAFTIPNNPFNITFP